ncbi:MAG: sugar ABC transporter permease [Thermoanaerobacteraceae bacterium]|nr:sugar ABC transporter permease [Thermoanaerobacteraceae bacterium]
MNETLQKAKRKVPLTKRFWWPQMLYCIVVLIPVTFLYLIIRIIPVAQTIWMSFYNWHLVKPDRPFIGLGNYAKLFKDQLFLDALRNTTVFAFVSVVTTLIVSLIIALMLEKTMRWKADTIYKVLFFLPVVPTFVSVSVIWKWIYDPSYGFLNYLVGLFGIKPRGWLIEPELALWAIILFFVWKNIGYYMILFLVGLKNIPSELYEAASLDGASSWQRIRHVTLPLLRPMTLFNLVMATMMAFNVFAPVYVMTMGEQGAPSNPVRVIVFDMYENGFRYLKMGYASAEATILLVIVSLLTLLELRLVRSEQ